MPGRSLVNGRVVQELERQLRDAKNDLCDARTTIDNLRVQLHEARANATRRGSQDDNSTWVDDGGGRPDLYVTSSDTLKARQALSRSLEGSPQSTPVLPLTNPFHDYSPLRRQIIQLSDGIFKPPPGLGILTKSEKRREATFVQLMKVDLPVRLPPRDLTDLIIEVFREKVEKFLYIMNWAEFETNLDALYAESVNDILPSSVRESFVRFFFAILGFTMIFSQDDRICRGRDRAYVGHEFIAVAYQMPLHRTSYDLDDVRAGLPIIFWLKSAHFLSLAHIWAGATVKIAQELGLHQELESLPSSLRDERRRVWWYLYVFDRYVSCERD
jgi:Fungal specific transcription factor domain